MAYNIRMGASQACVMANTRLVNSEINLGVLYIHALKNIIVTELSIILEDSIGRPGHHGEPPFFLQLHLCKALGCKIEVLLIEIKTVPRVTIGITRKQSSIWRKVGPYNLLEQWLFIGFYAIHVEAWVK